MRTRFRHPAMRFLCSMDRGDDGGGGGGGGGGDGGGLWYEPYRAKIKPETLAYLDGKKFQSIEAALDSGALSDRQARERNVIPAPNKEKLGEWEGWNVLGYDPDRAKYGAGIKPPKQPNGAKHDEALHDALINAGHKHRAPPAIVEAIAQEMSDVVNARLSEFAAKGVKLNEDVEKALRDELGTGYDTAVEQARRAAKQLGIGVEDAGELVKIFGNGDNIKGNVRLRRMLIKLGKGLGEGKLVDDEGAGGGATTPATAMAELRRLQGDADFQKIFQDSRHPQYKDYKARWQALTETAAKDPDWQRKMRAG